MTRAWLGVVLLLAGCETRRDLLGDGSPADATVERRPSELRSGDGLRPNGATCAADPSCLTGYCRDGFCCDLACTGPCSRCDEPGREGRCSEIAQGAAPPPGKTCPSQPREQCQLDGTCDGRGSCRRWPAGTICRPAACDRSPQATRLKLAWLCDGAGTCSAFAPDELDCEPYGCDPTNRRCFASCLNSSSCKKGANCDALGRCDGGLLPPGASCTDGIACASARCLEGVCCSSDCPADCETCALPGAAGKCVPVPAGAPPPAGKLCALDPQSVCGNDGTCDGKKKCRVSLPTKACAATTCTQSTLTLHFCNSDPSGPACVKKEVSCGAYACQPGGTSCYGSCASPSQCAVGASCVQGRCVACVTSTDCGPGQVCLNNQCL